MISHNDNENELYEVENAEYFVAMDAFLMLEPHSDSGVSKQV